MKWLVIVASLALASMSAAWCAPSTARARQATSVSAGSRSTSHKKSSRRRSSRRKPGQKAPTADRISEIQSALSNGGYYRGDPNGKWDSNTVAAVQKFQSANGIGPSGKLDAPTLQKLGLGSPIAGVSAPRPVVPPSCCSVSPSAPVVKADKSASSCCSVAPAPGQPPSTPPAAAPAPGSSAAAPDHH
jgi:hypothetical protein